MNDRLTRAFDLCVSILALIVLAPAMGVIALVLLLTSPGPLLYRARRTGRHGHVFTMPKFRTMAHDPSGGGSVITAAADGRVHALGRFLRRTKLDELPSLWNVVRGEMAVVGPRPEEPTIVERFYTDAMRSTLAVRPGLTSPGALWGSCHGDALLAGAGDPVRAYVERVLEPKLALEQVYLRRRRLLYDLWLVGRTAWTVLRLTVGVRVGDPPEMEDALLLLQRSGPPSVTRRGRRAEKSPRTTGARPASS